MERSEPEDLVRVVRVLFTRDGEGKLVDVNEDDGPRAPRLYVAWSARGTIWRVRDDVAPAVVARIAEIANRDGHADWMRAPAWVAEARAALGAIEREDGGIEYAFPAHIAELGETIDVGADNVEVLARWMASWRFYAGLGLPMKAVVVDGAAVCVCACVRRPDGATEAGLETHEDFRGHGFAARATAAWGQAVRARGLVPLYGTSWTNQASQRVAAKVGLTAYAGSISVR